MSVPREAWARWRVRTGYPTAVVCLWLTHPTLLSVLIGSAIALMGLLVRGYAAGYLRKNEALAEAGPYALTRNPLYFGSALFAAGFIVSSRSWLAAALLVAYFATFYPMVMRREEEQLRTRYGQAFEDYALRVPLFWPRLRPSGAPSDAQFSFAQYRRNREYQAAFGFTAIVVVLLTLAIWRK
jgi:protein-S-isoprenylcysteine O-methyltransferase Ste14